MRRSLLGLVVPLCVLTLGLAGCTPRPGAAAVVGDRRIPVSDVQQATADVRELVGADVQVDQPQVLSWLVLGPFVLDEAARRGVAASEDDARQQFTAAEPPRRVADPSDAAIRAVQSALVISQLRNRLQPEQAAQAAQQVSARVRAAGVHVSPRYGRFDLNNFSVQPVTPDWIVPVPNSTSAPNEPAPSPTP